MAYDKVVNSAALDAAMTATADAIRGKSGDDDAIAWDSSTGFADAIEAIPSGGSVITDGIVVTARDADGYATEVDFYGSVLQAYQFGFNGYGDRCNPLSLIASVNFKAPIEKCESCVFMNAVNLSGTMLLRAANVETLNLFSGCGELASVTIDGTGPVRNWLCRNCSNLLTFAMPKCTYTWCGSQAAWEDCARLETLELGSIGYPVTMRDDTSFAGLVQSGLVITLYTTGDYADTAVVNCRNGATNATIIIKASEDTTYTFDDGMSMRFAAGKTIITSTVEEAST